MNSQYSVVVKIMTTWTMHISNNPLCPCADYILSGQKIIEGRTYSQKRREMKVGDFIDFVNPDKDIIKCVVTQIKLYATLEDALFSEDLSQILPNVPLETAIELYNTGGTTPPQPWSRVEEREEAQMQTGYGFMLISIELV